MAFLAILFFFSSCQKEKLPLEKEIIHTEKESITKGHIINNIDIKINNNILEFNSKNDFYSLFDNIKYEELESLINRLAKDENFISYSESNPNFSENESMLIGNLISNQGIIKIGDYYLLLDFENKYVYATKRLSASDFIANYTTNTSDVYKIHMDTETFEAIDEIENQNVSRGGLFCRQRYARRKEKSGYSELAPGTWSGFSTSVQGRVKYLSYGIYYELQSAVIVHQNGISKAKYSYTTDYYCERRCSKKTFSGNNITRNYLNTLKMSTANRMYWNPRALKGYRISCKVTSFKVMSGGNFSYLVQKVNSVSMNDW